ncbi:MAG TPA: isoprenylcysteine carboxylmethyltransferase family protein [Nitrospirota bacterium]|jgi:protein-S-isoprenylcysteine O-methyltransferase Ste14
MKKENYSFFERKRKPVSRLFMLVCLLLVLFTAPSWQRGSAIDIAFEVSGILLVLAGVSGRLWATMYIGGRKNAELVMSGPYSMCRNPLYLFSFIAGIGISLLLKNVALLAVFVVGFSIYYPLVIRSEEGRLRSYFGEAFDGYVATTPMFIPKFTGLSFEGARFVPSLMWKNFKDSLGFLLFIPVTYLIAWLHESGALKVISRLP